MTTLTALPTSTISTPPSLRDSIVRRLALLERFSDPREQEIARRVSAADPVTWFNDWVWGFDPRELGPGETAYQPFDLWPKQEDYVRWVMDRIARREEWLVEKSRDWGITYLNAGVALNRWLFVPGFTTTFGSNKQGKVDTLGDPSSIFGKLRVILDHLPDWMLPDGWNPHRHDTHMRLINPANGNIIAGESGDDMGRGGRSSLYIIDEAAHVERAEKVDAATLATSECRGWASSVNGMGNVFARKRHSGRIQVFTAHWRDDPRKSEAWAEKKKYELNDDAIWAAEYEIDYAASVEGVCIPGPWVEAALKLPEVAPIKASAVGTAGLDVGAGKAESVFIARKGALVEMPIAWRDPDTTETAHRALDAAEAAGVKLLNYDPVGVGAGVASTLNGNRRPGIRVQGVNVGLPPTDRSWPDGRTSAEMFGNLKAELWWLARNGFKRSFERLKWELGQEGGIAHPLHECIALPPDRTLATQLSLPKWNRNEKGKIVIESKDKLKARGIASPDRAEAFVLALCEDLQPRMRVREFPFG